MKMSLIYATFKKEFIFSIDKALFHEKFLGKEMKMSYFEIVEVFNGFHPLFRPACHLSTESAFEGAYVSSRGKLFGMKILCLWGSTQRAVPFSPRVRSRADRGG